MTPRATLAFVAGCAAAIATYALLRTYQAIALGEANPATVFARLHLAYFWRTLTSMYVGGMAACITAFATPRDPARRERMMRAMTGVLVGAAALLVIQTVLLP